MTVIRAVPKFRAIRFLSSIGMNFGGRRGLLKGWRVDDLCCLSGENPVAEQD